MDQPGGRQYLPRVEQGWTPEMASTAPLCTEPRKEAYPTRQLAKDAAATIRRGGGRRLEPYECACGQFHLTKHRRV